MKLLSTVNDRATERAVLRAAHAILGRQRLQAVFEHGHWWVTNPRTGAQWDAVDAVGYQAVGGFDFEQVTEEA